jgi:hypothetical protein
MKKIGTLIVTKNCTSCVLVKDEIKVSGKSNRVDIEDFTELMKRDRNAALRIREYLNSSNSTLPVFIKKDNTIISGSRKISAEIRKA